MNIILYPWFLLVTSTVSVCYIRVLMSFTNVGMTHGHDHDQQQQRQPQPPPPPYLPPHLPHPDSHPPRPPIFRDRTSITIIWDNTNHSPFTIASHVSIFLSVCFPMCFRYLSEFVPMIWHVCHVSSLPCTCLTHFCRFWHIVISFWLKFA